MTKVTRKSPIPLLVMAVLSLLVAAVSLRFFALDLNLSFPDMQDHITNRRTFFLMHITAAPFALAAGALQFFPRLRAKRPGLHRWSGRVYVFAIAIGGVGGVLLAISSQGGLVANVGFALLSILWMAFTAIAIYYIQHRNIAAHQRWMVRSFALTFAGVTLRLYLGIAFAFGSEYTDIVAVLAWICWVPNLILAEYILRRLSKKA